MENDENLPVVSPSLPNLSQSRLVDLAKDIAMGIRSREEIFRVYGISEAQYQLIELNPFYKHALETLLLEWSKPSTVEQRLKVVSAALLEEALPNIGGRMLGSTESLTAQVEAAKMLMKAAGIGEVKPKTSEGAAEKFIININLGADEKILIEKNVTPDSAQAGASEISGFSEGERSPQAVRMLAKGKEEPEDV